MTSPSAAPPRLPWDAADPYPFYEKHRDDGAVWDDIAQTWLVYGYREAQQVLGGSGWINDPFANPNAHQTLADTDTEVIRRSMLFADGADHHRYRDTVRDVFTPSFIAGLSEGVEAIAAALIGDPPTATEFDFMTGIAEPMPLAVIAEWLGLDVESSRVLGAESAPVMRTLMPLASAEEMAAGVSSLAKLVTHFLPLAADRRNAPSDDLLSFIAADSDLLLEEVAGTALNIGIGGHATTANLLGAAAIRLLTPRADGRRMVDEIDPADPALISELLRLESPLQAAGRIATEDQRIGDTDIAPGTHVVVVIGAANRDPAFFDEPDQLRLTRRGPTALAFGYGVHYCLGPALARLQIAMVLRQIMARKPVLCGPAVWGDSPAFRGPVSLPMKFEC